MTVAELMQKTCASVTIKDGNSKCELTPWNIFFLKRLRIASLIRCRLPKAANLKSH